LNRKTEIMPTFLSEIPGDLKQKTRKPGIRQ